LYNLLRVKWLPSVLSVDNWRHPSTGSSEVAASIISWTLFGTAMQHGQDFADLPTEALAAQTATIFNNGLEEMPVPAR
jgi:hypothetical protein